MQRNKANTHRSVPLVYSRKATPSNLCTHYIIPNSFLVMSRVPMSAALASILAGLWHGVSCVAAVRQARSSVSRVGGALEGGSLEGANG